MHVRTLLTVLAAAGLTATLATARASAHTKIVVSTWFTINGKLSDGLKIVKTLSGSCWIGSEGSQRSDAWRCMSGNGIYDPCYSGGPPTWVACPTGLRGIIRLNLTKRLPSSGNPPLNTNTADPESVLLPHNVDCGFEGGATGTVAGLRLNYYCSNKAWLLGSPNRRGALWTILELPSLNATHATAVTILVARY